MAGHKAGKGNIISSQDSGAGNMSICVVKDTPLTYSETFILKHAQMLKTEVYIMDSGLPRGAWYFPLIAFANYIGTKVFRKSLYHRIRQNRFAEYLKRRGAQVVLAEFGPTGVSVARTCKDLGIPLVVHFHGYDASRKDVLRKNRGRYRRMFKIASRILVVSEDMKQDLIHNLRAPRDKVQVCLYGIDFDQPKMADHGKNKDLFMAVGRFVEKKSPTSTLLAFYRVNQKFPHARLVMVGHGKLFGVCQSMIAELGLEEAVELRGVCSHEEVFDLMSRARCFVQHSLATKDNDKEGTPVGILEASASGLPVVSTLHAGIKQAVVNGKTGYLVEEGDIIAMSERMMEFVGNPDLAESFGKRGYTYVKELYSSTRMKAVLIDVFRQVIAEAEEARAHTSFALAKEGVSAELKTK